VVIYVVSIGMALLYDLLGIQGTSGNQSAIEDALHSPTGYLMLLSVIFLAPLVEELLFRKLCFGALQVKLHCPKILAVLISAILFAAMHGIDIFYFQYLAMALVISGSYAIFKNDIYIPMGIHFLNNLSVLFVLVVMV
jgi:membrane protease YdiL (CAAX protease family)